MRIKILVDKGFKNYVVEWASSLSETDSGKWCVTGSLSYFAVNHVRTGIAVIHQMMLAEAKISMEILDSLYVCNELLGDMTGDSIAKNIEEIYVAYVNSGGKTTLNTDTQIRKRNAEQLLAVLEVGHA